MTFKIVVTHCKYIPVVTDNELMAVIIIMIRIAANRTKKSGSSLLGASLDDQKRRHVYSPKTVAIMASDAGLVTTAFVHENKNENKLP